MKNELIDSSNVWRAFIGSCIHYFGQCIQDRVRPNFKGHIVWMEKDIATFFEFDKSRL